MFGWKQELTISNIYKSINDYDIFSYYIGGKILIGRAINHPLRHDATPSFAIYRYENSLRWKDFATGDNGSVFNFVMNKFNVNFREALCIINTDFQLGLDGMKITKTEAVAPIIHNFDIKSVPEGCKQIRVRFCKPTIKHVNYWKKYGITKELLIKYEVSPIKGFKINDTTIVPNDICFAYHFGDYRYKILQPGSDYKWVSNCSANIIQGYNQLPEKGELCIITSSLKDVMVLDRMGYTAVAPQSENTMIDVDELKDRFNNILLYYNNDEAGYKASEMHSIFYHCDYIINHKTYPKDPSDLVKEFGFKKAKAIVDKLIKQWQTETEQQETTLKGRWLVSLKN